MRKSILFIFILSVFLKFNNCHAQNSPIKFSAYLDTYYTYDFSKPDNHQRLYVTQYDRHNEFNLNHAWLKGAYASDRIRVNLALQTGTYPINNYGGEPEELYRMIYEANAGYHLTEKSWVDIGVFGGHFGYESALARERELLSPALSTEYTPYYQTGVRYTYNFTENTTLRAVLLNGWQNIGETNNSKSVGMAIDHQVNDFLWLSYGNYYGNEMPHGTPAAHRLHNNAIIKLTPGEKLSFVGILDHTTQESTTEDGNNNVLFLTMISNVSVTEKFSMAGRYEFVKDEAEILITNPLNVNGFKTHILSFAISLQPEKNVAFKVEPKYYTSDSITFEGSNASYSNAFAIHAGFSFLIGDD